ncbi:MAG: TonB-dependent receptor plug domain-containing protein, partial [Inhella sp.]
MYKRNRIHLAALMALSASATMTSFLVLPQAALAQSAEGSLYGRAAAGTAVTILNLDTGATRTISAAADGSFTFSRLAPGRYRVSAGGQTSEVMVAIGSGTQVQFERTELERIEVTSRRVRTMIDLNSVETNSVFTAEQITNLPVARNVNAIAYLAPGVVQGDDGLGDGKLPSFAGASVGENGYYINGFDVTNIRNFLSYANLPFDAISQQQVKAGGYGAEYGRSLGGVISLLTKRGTNEWKGGGSFYWNPKQLAAEGRNVENLDPSTRLDGGNRPAYSVFRAPATNDLMTANAYVGGPIVKDKLFVFALLEGRNDRRDRFDTAFRSTNIKSAEPNGMVKIDFMPHDNHHLEYTGISNKEVLEYTDY